jgi:hypothetical protein
MSNDSCVDSCLKTYLPPRVTLTDANNEYYSLIEQGLGPRLVLKTLVEGRNIDIVEGPTGSLIINATTNLEDVTLNDTGAGMSLINDGTGPYFLIKKLIPGNDIDITEGFPDGNLIINSTVDLQNVRLLDTGSGTSLVSNGTGPNLEIKSLVAGNDMDIINGPTGSLTINSLVDLQDVRLLNTGSGTSLVSNGTGPNLEIKSLVAGNDMDIIDGPSGSLTINSLVDLQDVRLLNTGSGQSLVSNGTGPNLEIKSLVAGNDITITDGPTGSLTINSLVDLQDVKLLNTGSGQSLVSDDTGPNLGIKSLVAGSRMSITSSATALTLQSLSQINNLGGGAPLVTNGIGPIMNIKSLLGSNSIIIDGSNPNTITISQVDLEPLIAFNMYSASLPFDIPNNVNRQITLDAGVPAFTWGTHTPGTNSITILQTGSYLMDYNFQSTLGSATVQFSVAKNNSVDITGAQITMDFGTQYGVGQPGGPINTVNYRNLTLVENYVAGDIIYFWIGSTNVSDPQFINVGNISMKRLY